MHKLCAIISGGDFSPLSGIETADYIIACDRGYLYAKDCGIRPHLLVGDFDSYTDPLPADIPRLNLPVEKDDTDTLAAIRWALENGYERIALHCALGGRLDHLMANMQCGCFVVEHGGQMHIVDTQCEMLFVTDCHVTLPPRSGYALSLFAMSEICLDVSVTGVKYPLHHATLHNSFPIGVSNEWVSEAEISVGKGILMIMQTKMPQ